MAERLAADISEVLRRLADGRPEIAQQLVDAADRLDVLITLLAKAERDRDEARAEAGDQS